jgi:pimeloyl-ACP methyl ester carboxylesterase
MGMGKREVTIPLREIDLEGELELGKSGSLVIFAHGSGSSRRSPRNQFVAQTLREAGMGTLLFDLLTAEEEVIEERTAHLRFNIPLLAERLVGATRWVLDATSARELRIGYFGASTGAAAALVAGAQMGDAVGAVVSRGGRPDLAGEALGRVTAPTLLIVGGDDRPVIPLNEEAYGRLRCEKEMRIVRGASHLFEESGTLETVAALAAKWFAVHLEAG